MKEQVLKYFIQLLSEVSDAEKEQLDWGLAKIFPKDDSAKVGFNVGISIDDQERKEAYCNIAINVVPVLYPNVVEAKFIEIDKIFFEQLPKGIDTKFSKILDLATESDIQSILEGLTDVLTYKLFPVHLHSSPTMAIAPNHGCFMFYFIANEKGNMC